MLRRSLWFLVLSLVFVACGGGRPAKDASRAPTTDIDLAVPAGSSQTVAAAPDQQVAATGQATSSDLPVGPDDAVWGSATAPVTIVEFLDLQCPFCSRVQPTLDALKQQYGTDKVRIVYKHNPLPFHTNALPAALAAQAVFEIAGSEAFFAFTRQIFDNQASMSSDYYERVARGLGVDVGQLRQHMRGAHALAKVQADMDLARRIGANGTPDFRINGIDVSGAQPLDQFRSVIDLELPVAQALAAKGTAPGQVYAERVTANLKAVPLVPSPSPRKPEPPDTTIWKIPIAGSPVQGPRNALVTIVEISDLQCPFCKRVQPTLDELMKHYPGKLRIVWKHNPLPFHPRALPAAMVAIEAWKEKGDAGFFKTVAAIYASQPKLDDSDLLAIAHDQGLDAARVKRAIDKKTYQKTIDADQQVANDFNARGTPHFFINGYRVTGAQPVEKFEEVIDEQLAKAEALVAKGVPAAGVYADIMKDAKGVPPPETKSVAAPTKANPSRGPARATVVVQMWSDFQCPFCKRALPTLEQLEKAYPGRVRVVWRNYPLPFHQHAVLAAEAAMEAFAQKGNAGFWKMHDLLYANQAASGGLERPAIEGYAAQIGLDMARFNKALDDSAHADVINADAKEAQGAQINGTPAFVINGYYVSGAQPLAAFKKVVDYALKHPKKP